MTPRARALAATVALGAPLAALLVWAPSLRETDAVAVGGSTADVTVHVHAWGFSPSVIRVAPGQAVRFIASTDDIRHGFAINELGINLALTPGRDARSPEVSVTLPEGAYTIHCSVFCGLGHPSMKARLVVGTPRPTLGERAPWAASALVLGTAVAAVLRRR
jgi:heme/copper-type cytochrome/quinol oxidase subunit 2